MGSVHLRPGNRREQLKVTSLASEGWNCCVCVQEKMRESHPPSYQFDALLLFGRSQRVPHFRYPIWSLQPGTGSTEEGRSIYELFLLG